MEKPVDTVLTIKVNMTNEEESGYHVSPNTMY